MVKILIYLLLPVLVLQVGYTVNGQELKNITPELKQQFDLFIEQAEMAEQNGDLRTQSINLSKAAFILWQSNRLYDAVDVFIQVAEIYEKLEDKVNLRNTCSNIGLLYTDLQDIDRAKQYFDRCLEISRVLGQQELIASGLIDIAYIASAMGNFDESNTKLLEALDMALVINNQKLLLNIYGLMAANHKSLNNITEATSYQDKYQIVYRQQQELSEKTQATQREVKSLATIQRTQEEIKRQDIELELRNLRIKAVQDNLKRAEVEAKERDNQIKLLEQEKLLQDLQIKEQASRQQAAEALLRQQQAVEERQKILIISGLVVLLLALIVAVILYLKARDKQRSNTLLEEQNTKIKEKSRDLEEALEKIERQNLQIRQSINYAKGIQQAMLPPSEQLRSFIPDSFIFWQPRDVVSGDFYWFKQVDIKFDLKRIFDYQHSLSSNETEIKKLTNANKVLLAAVDCTGHGVPGAFMSMIGYNLLDEITNKGITRPDMVLEQLHFGVRSTLKQNVTNNKDGMDLALCLIDKKEKKLTYAGANNPIIYIQNGKLTHIKGTMCSIGGVQDPIPKFALHEIEITTPTAFYIFSDGFIDQFGGEEGRKFMIKHLKTLLLEIHTKPFDQQEAILRQAISEWMGNKYSQIDDILVMGFKPDF